MGPKSIRIVIVVIAILTGIIVALVTGILVLTIAKFLDLVT
jgi:hypothetical protein